MTTPAQPALFIDLTATGAAKTAARRADRKQKKDLAKIREEINGLYKTLSDALATSSPTERPAIHSPKDAADLLMPFMVGLDHEELWVLNLDTRNRVTRIIKLYSGSLNQSTVRVAEMFKAAIENNAATIIMAHNHPSGDPAPSPEDVALTRATREAGKILDIDLLDHVVIGLNRFVSLKEKNLGF